MNLFNADHNSEVSCYRIPSIITASNGDLIVAIDDEIVLKLGISLTPETAIRAIKGTKFDGNSSISLSKIASDGEFHQI